MDSTSTLRTSDHGINKTLNHQGAISIYIGFWTDHSNPVETNQIEHLPQLTKYVARLQSYSLSVMIHQIRSNLFSFSKLGILIRNMSDNPGRISSFDLGGMEDLKDLLI